MVQCVLYIVCVMYTMKGVLSYNALGRSMHPLKCSNSSCDQDQTLAVYHNTFVYRQEGDIIIGGIVPIRKLSDTTYRYQNVALVEAIVWAINSINNRSDILANLTLGFEIRDSMGDAAFASVQALELAAKNVVGIVGPGSSSVAVHLASLMGSLGFPLISYAATSNLLSQTDRFSLFARTVPSDAYQCSAITDLIKHYEWGYVSILFSPETYGTEGSSHLQELLELEGVCVDEFHSLNPSLSTDSASQLLADMFTAQNINNRTTSTLPAKVIVLFATTKYAFTMIHGAKVLKERYETIGKDVGFFKDLTWIGPESWSSNTDLLNVMRGSAIGNFIGITPTSFPLTDFQTYYKGLTLESTSNPWFPVYYELCKGNITNCAKNSYKQGPYEEPAVLAVEVLANTLERLLGANRTPDTLDPCIKPAAPVVNTTDLFYLRNSAIGGCLFKSMIKEHFRTVTRDNVTFNRTNGDFEAMFSFLTIDSDYSQTEAYTVDIGYWNKSGIFIHLPLLPFNNSTQPDSVCSVDCGQGFRKIMESKVCCWNCEMCPLDTHSEATNSKTCVACGQGFISNPRRTGCSQIRPTYLNSSHPAAVVLALLGIIGASATVFTIAVFIKYSDTPLVKASSKELCLVMLCGVFIGYISSLLSIGRPNNTVCLCQLILGTLFGCLTIVPLFLKTARVFSLFFQAKNSAGAAPRYLLPMWQSIICLLLILVEAIILIAVIVFFPLKATRKYPDRSTVFITCEADSKVSTAIALGLPMGYIVVFMVMSTVMSYLVRKLPTNFQEAKYVCLAQIIVIIALTAFLPAYFVSRGIWQTFSVGVASQICATAILVLIFLKKVNIILLYPERNKVMISKDELKSLDMSRKERRKSYLNSESCHMCGEQLRHKKEEKSFSVKQPVGVCREMNSSISYSTGYQKKKDFASCDVD